MKTLEYKTDLCVIGGGMAGLCCAIAASRHGIKVVLIHDRHVLGGNASSEIRMWIGGCHGKDNREGGIIEEIMLENFYQNPSLKYPLWDSVLYQKAMTEENLRQVVKASSFTLKEKIAFYKKKWLKEHIAAMCCWGIGIITVLVIGIILTFTLLVAAAMLLLLVGHAWRNNTMMAYVERNAFDGTERKD